MTDRYIAHAEDVTLVSGSIGTAGGASISLALVADREPETIEERAQIVQWLEDLADSMRDRGYSLPR